MTRKWIPFVCLLMLLAGCQKNVLQQTGKNLGEVTVESSAGELPVLITAEGVWQAVSGTDWISVDEAWHRDAYTILVHYGSNQSIEGMHRSARTGFVLIRTADGAECDTLKIHQRGIVL